MASDPFRIVRNSFWTDPKVIDSFTPEDRFFFIYLLTNPRTTQLGIYEFSLSDATRHLGYSKETIKLLLERFEHVYGVIKYSVATGEVAIKNFLRHSIVTGGKPVMDCLKREAKKVKDKELLGYVFEHLKEYDDLNKTVEEFIATCETGKVSMKEEKTTNGMTMQQILEHNFKLLYDLYPKKVGRTEAFKRYKLWVTTGKVVSGQKIKLTNQQIAFAIENYVHHMKENNTELQFYKNFDTFMGSSILDYLEEERVAI